VETHYEAAGVVMTACRQRSTGTRRRLRRDRAAPSLSSCKSSLRRALARTRKTPRKACMPVWWQRCATVQD